MRKGNPTRPRRKPDKEKAFEETIKGAKISKGLFTLYQAESVPRNSAHQLDRMYIFSLTCESGLGEGGFYGAEMCGQSPVTFRKEGKAIQLVAKNTRFVARKDLPIQRAVRRSVVSMAGLKTSLETRAPLNESLARIDETLKANMQSSAL